MLILIVSYSRTALTCFFSLHPYGCTVWACTNASVGCDGTVIVVVWVKRANAYILIDCKECPEYICLDLTDFDYVVLYRSILVDSRRCLPREDNKSRRLHVPSYVRRRSTGN